MLMRSSQRITCDGYPSVRLRDSTCWNVKMMFYSTIFNITLVSILFYWKIAIPMLLLILVPMGLNVWWLATAEERRK